MASPIISIVMPVRNGADLLCRALDFVLAQTFTDWELLVVDDGSEDDTPRILREAVAADSRIHAFRHSERRGVSAARNTALSHARGDLIAYLDHDDEFAPRHLARAVQLRDRGDVLVFRYDVTDPLLPPGQQTQTYDPAPHFPKVYTQTIVTPLGVVHRRSLLEKTGGFDESLDRDVDGDLWRRFASIGARFAFSRARSGTYHVRPNSLSRTTPRAAIGPVLLRAGGQSVRIPVREGWRIAMQFDRHEYGRLPASVLRSPPVVLDVGANVGLFALYFREKVHADAVIHCFEPNPPSLDLLGITRRRGGRVSSGPTRSAPHSHLPSAASSSANSDCPD